MRNRVVKEFLVLLLIFVLRPELMSATQDTKEIKKVLLISSSSPLKEGGTHVISSFEKTLKEKMDVRISVEYMDGESSMQFNVWKEWMLELFKAYHEPPIAVVILGNEAWNVYRKVCLPEWHDIPVVLGLVKPLFVDYEKAMSGDSTMEIADFPKMETTFDDFKITGYYYIDYIRENLELVKQLQPEIRYVAFYYDNRYSLKFFSNYLLDLFNEIDSLDVCYLNGRKLSTTNLIDTIAGMDDRYALLSAGWYTDVNRYQHAYSMLHNELARSNSHTLYQLQDQGFSNTNFLGGYFISGKDLGMDVANLTYSVLKNGIENSPSFQLTSSSPKYHINYPAIEHFGIDPRRFPENVLFYNKTPSLIEEYPMEVFLFMMVLVLMLILFFVILRYRKRKEEEYIRVNQRLHSLLKAMPDVAFIFDSSLRIIDIVNPQDTVLLGLRWQELIGKGLHEAVIQNKAFKEAVALITENVICTRDKKAVQAFDYQVVIDDSVHYLRARTVPFNQTHVICFCHNVTVYVEAEREVLKLKTFLQSIVDNLSVGLFVKDVSNGFRYLFYNKEVAEFHNEGDAKSLLGKNDFELNDPDAERCHKEDLMALASIKPMSFERIIMDKETGEPYRWGVVTKNRILNNDGTSYIIGVIIDTTEIRRKELELEDIRSKLSVALDAGSLSAWMYDVEKQWFSTLYHTSVVGNGFSFDQGMELLHPEDRDKYRQFFSLLLSGEVERKREVFRFKRGDSFNSYETYAIVVRSGKTGKVKRIVGTEKDITEEIRQQRELVENKFKLEIAFDAARIIPWEYNVSTGMFSSPNPLVFEYVDVSLQQYLTYMAPADRYFMEVGIRDMVSGKSVSMEFQARITFPGKEMRWYEIHGLVFERDEEGNVVRILGVRWDITSLKMTNELIELRNKAEEANRLKSAFLANMSHEIRTPLNAIVGFSNLIAEAEDRSEIEQFVHIIETNNELLLRLINDILDLSKIEAGQLDFNYSRVDVSTIFYDLEQIYKYRIKEGVSLQTDFPELSCTIYSEKNRLTQVISNFLSNACKFTTKGFIRMGYSYTEDSLRFFVQDTGKGIASENIPFVFNRFSKFDSFMQGTGLGLSICESIIHHLGGDIGVESELGKGTLFWFTLPCKTEITRAGLEAMSLQSKSQAKNVTGRQYTVMIAEDNDTDFLLLLNMLKKNYQVIRASNGKDAIRLYHESHPDLILMDIAMPVMNGIEAIKEIRKTDRAISIIAFSNYANDHDSEEAFAAGCTEFISGPVNEIHLLERLKASL